ncbi:MAG: phage tail protein [Alphaproteobacteria bacterium]|nr:phage tail protein [Alphaproteobacteria bacterium]
MADPYIGEIRIFAFNFAPEDWLVCNGQLLPLSQFQALAAVIGNQYGGDGKTTIAVPNLQGRAVADFGSGSGLTPRKIASQFGDTTVSVNYAQMPQHDHDVTMKVSSTVAAGMTAGPATNGTSSLGAVGIPIAGKPGPQVQKAYGAPTADVTLSTNMSPEIVGYAGGAAPSGAPTPHENRQPYLAMNFCISTAGNFPIRQ